MATHEFLRHLASLGHEVVVCPHMTGARVVLDGVKIDRSTMLTYYLQRADALVSHAGDKFRAHRQAARLGVPSVRFYHGGNFREEDNIGAALVVFNSETAQAKADWSGRSVVCRPAINPDDYRTTPGDAVTLVNLSKEKGVKTLWRVAHRMPETRFVGVHGHTNFQEQRQAGNVTVLPTTNDMREVYSRTRVLLMPSAFETWGRVGVEAMCSGIPVIAHPTDGLRESLGDAGIFVDRGDADAWVEQLRRLEDPDEYAAASAKALERVAQLDHRAELDRFAEAIESVVGVAA